MLTPAPSDPSPFQPPWIQVPKAKKDIAMHIYAEDAFCIFVPDDPSKGIGDQEQSSHTYCTPRIATDLGRPTIPNNWIVSKHFSRNRKNGHNYTQITGQFNLYAKFGGKAVNFNDGGGQYDSNGVPDPAYPDFVGSPHGSICAGYEQYVHLWQGDWMPGSGVGRFCIRWVSRCAAKRTEQPT